MDIPHCMSIVLDTSFYIWFIIIHYYKARQILLQNATAILLEKMTEVYYKMQCFLQIATVSYVSQILLEI